MNFLVAAVIVIGIAILLLRGFNRIAGRGQKQIKISDGDRADYKKYDTLDEWEKDLKVLWQGPPRTIEFTYEKFNGETTRRKVDVNQVIINSRGDLYLRGFCNIRKEERTFDIQNITTKILDKSRRYEVPEWLDEKLGLDDF